MAIPMVLPYGTRVPGMEYVPMGECDVPVCSCNIAISIWTILPYGNMTILEYVLEYVVHVYVPWYYCNMDTTKVVVVDWLACSYGMAILQ